MKSIHTNLALALVLCLAIPTGAEAQLGAGARMRAEEAANDLAEPIFGGIAIAGIGIADFVFVGMSVHYAMSEGNGLPRDFALIELVLGLWNAVGGALFTYFGATQGDAGFLGFAIPFAAVSPFLIAHAIYSLVDPPNEDTRSPPDEDDDALWIGPFVTPRAGGVVVGMHGVF